MTVLAVCGLAAEARIARNAGWRAVAAGGDAAIAAVKIEQAIDESATGLVSFGICGGLDPALACGSVVLARAVATAEGTRIPVERHWHEALGAALHEAGISTIIGDLIGLNAVVDGAARKLAMFLDTGAVAVDMESHLVARAAQAAGLPFVVLRVVADRAERDLPPAVLVGVDAEGRSALRPVLCSLARRPGQLPALIRVALDTRRALAVLRRLARNLADKPMLLS
jgi:adenosylhomocysteine nucleosidase